MRGSPQSPATEAFHACEETTQVCYRMCLSNRQDAFKVFSCLCSQMMSRVTSNVSRSCDPTTVALDALRVCTGAVSLSIWLAYPCMILCGACAIAWTSELTIVCQSHGPHVMNDVSQPARRCTCKEVVVNVTQPRSPVWSCSLDSQKAC